MKYLQDRALLLLGLLFFNAYVGFLFYQSNVPRSAAISYFALWFLFVGGAMAHDYWKRSQFNRRLETTLGQLDQKYLITEMIKSADFLEGQQFLTHLQTINKSMIDRVNTFAFAQTEYQEYIEMWIHEVKTPLAAARLLIENDKNQTTLEIGRELDQVDDYLTQVLFYARSNHVEKDFMVKPVVIKPLVQKSLRKNVQIFSKKKIVLDIENLDGVVYSDAKWLQFMIDQILSNAIKYLKEQPKIAIYTEEKNQSLTLTIEDNGVGIPASDLGRIFEKGFTGENGRIFGKSTGIGLYLCKKMGDQLGISLTAHSEVGVGTKIQMTFPMSDMFFK